MIPLVSDVYRAARSLLNDEPNDIFRNWVLETHYETAYRDLYRVLSIYGNSRVEKHAHYNLPAHMTYLDPATFGAENFGEPTEIFTRSLDQTFDVIAAVPSPATNPPVCLLTLDAVHSFAEGDSVVVYGVGGISDDVNDQWTVTLDGASSSQIKLLGSTATGSYTSGGVVSNSNERFSGKFRNILNRVQFDEAVGRNSNIFNWTGDRFRFSPVAEIRQLRISYLLSGSPPIKPSSSIGIDDSLDFLAYRAAGLAAPTKGMPDRGRALTFQAVGDSGVADGLGGMLQAMVNLGLHTQQQRVIQTQRFLPRLTGGVRKRYTSW